jgi:hypothetical protein
VASHHTLIAGPAGPGAGALTSIDVRDAAMSEFYEVVHDHLNATAIVVGDTIDRRRPRRLADNDRWHCL